MAKNIFIPKLGMTMTEAKLVEWKVEEGDRVEEGQVVLVIETDKVTFEIEAAASGFLHILAEAGSVLPVGQVAGMLAETREALIGLEREGPGVAEPGEEDAVVDVSAGSQAMPQGRPERVKISPLARKMAKEHQIDITQIKGSGPGGRIKKEDIEKALQSTEAAPLPADPVASAEIYEGKQVKATVPLSGMRQTIANHMHRSLSVAAQLTLMSEIDMTELITLRNHLLSKESSLGVRISFTDLFVFILGKALRNVPIINSSLIEREIKIWEDINIGIAVALEIEEHETGLVVPVIKGADKKSLLEISLKVKELTEKARNKKLMPDDMTGGTFTITNTGMFLSEWHVQTPIINQPETAILGTSSIVEKPVVREGQIVVRPILPISFTFDHRVVDGASAGKFVNSLNMLMRTPDLLLL